MKRIITPIVPLLLMFFSAAVYAGQDGKTAKFTKHFNDTLFAISAKGQISVEVMLEEKEYKIGRDVIRIVIHDNKDHDVEDARLVVSVTGMAEPLKVTEKGDGLYLAPKAGLPKDGEWELRIDVTKKKIDDRAVFRFPDAMNMKIPAGKYDSDMLQGKR